MSAKKFLSIMLSICIIVLGAVAPVGVNAEGNDVDMDMSEAGYETFTMDALEGMYKTQGRTTVINNILMTDYSAAGMEFNAYCEGDVAVTFNATAIVTGDDGGCYFTVIVDGVKKSRDFCRITATGDTTVTIAEDLLFGEHTFEIYRQTEIERATIGIKSVTLNGSFLSAPAKNKMYVEFIGDSITTAYGNLTLGSTGPAKPENPLHQDATQGYAYLTAKSLGADWSIVARQGIGAVTGYQPVNMQTVYPLLRHHKDANTVYDFARQPDYVVIGLGANDFSTYNNVNYTNPVMTVADVKKGFSDMFDLVHSKNPNAKIIWVYGWTNSSANAGTTIKEVVAEKGGADAGFYTLEVEKNTQGANNHSYYTAHAEYANELTAFITEIENAPAPSVIPGDIDGDTKVNLNDVVTLAQYVAGWENVSVDEAVIDADGNGTVDLSDVVILSRYVAGWQGIDLLMNYDMGVEGVANKTLATYTDESGFTMPYTLLVPKNYNSSKEYPVLLFFHGADAKGNENTKPIQKLEPFYDTDAKTMSEAIVLIPQCPQKGDEVWGNYAGWWRYNTDGKGTLNVAMNLLEDKVLNKYNCDPNRFYVMGLSMGGEATWKTLEQHSEKIAAAVPMCGSRIGNTSFEDATLFADVPIWMYHGTDDATIPFSDSQTRYDNLIAAGAENVTFTVLEGWDHNVWEYAAEDTAMIKWLFEQKLS